MSPSEITQPKKSRRSKRKPSGSRTEYVTRSIPKEIAPVVIPFIDEILNRWRLAQRVDPRFRELSETIAAELVEAVRAEHGEQLAKLPCLSHQRNE
jgi:hypothetical protein